MPIICTTLSMTGSDAFEQIRGSVDCLIVDESCHAIEPLCLIPFALDPKRTVLVGDKGQTITNLSSSNAEFTKFGRSLFERLLQSGHKPKVKLGI